MFASFQCFSQNWKWEFNTDGKAVIQDIAVDPNQSVYCCGYFSDTVTIQGTTIYADTSNYNIFVAKFDSAHQLIWIKTGGANSSSSAYYTAEALTIDLSGNVYVTGSYTESGYFDGYALTDSGFGSQGFFIKIDPSGQTKWVRDISVNGRQDYGVDISADNTDHIFICGGGANLNNYGQA